VYSAETILCYGNIPTSNLPSYVVAYGNDPTEKTKTGFDYNEPILFFQYDADDNKYYNLIPETITSILNNNSVTAKFAPLNLLKVSGFERSNEITLNIDIELSKIVLKISCIDEWKTGDDSDILFNVNLQNISNLVVSKSLGKGELKKGTFYKNNRGYHYKYTVQPDDVSIVINAAGTNTFSGEIVTAKKIILIKHDAVDTPNLIYENRFFTLYKRDGNVYGKAKASKVAIEIKRNGRYGSYGKSFQGEQKLSTVKRMQKGEWYFRSFSVLEQYRWKKYNEFKNETFVVE